jgi:hypothetical protein
MRSMKSWGEEGMDYRLWYSEIARMEKEGDRESLINVLKTSNDQYARRMAAQALCSFCDIEIADTFARLKFTDTDPGVREVASRGHERIIATLRAQGKL